MEYIVNKRFRGKALCGYVNIPATTICEERDNIIYHNGKQICYATSENAHRYFSRNNDSNGLLRGLLICKIQDLLNKRDKGYEDRWERIWNDARCQPYKRKEHEDHWLWNHTFFLADIDDLKYIANLIGINVDKNKMR